MSRKKDRLVISTPDPALLGARTDKKIGLQTSICQFTNPEGRIVTLVASEHIGDPDYYAQLRKIVDDTAAAGAQVRVETLRRGEDDKARNDFEAAGLEALNRQIDGRFQVCQALGLPWVGHRESAMAPDPTWIVSDAHAMEMVRLQGAQHLERDPQLTGPQRLLAIVEDLKAKAATSKVARWSVRHMRNRIVNQVLQRGQEIQDGILHADWWSRQTIYAWRECQEALKILAAPGDVTAVWSSCHIRGLSEVLLRNRFELTHTQWLTAIGRPDSNAPVPLT